MFNILNKGIGLIKEMKHILETVRNLRHAPRINYYKHKFKYLGKVHIDERCKISCPQWIEIHDHVHIRFDCWLEALDKTMQGYNKEKIYETSCQWDGIRIGKDFELEILDREPKDNKSRIIIKENVYIGEKAKIAASTLISIGKNVIIGPNALIQDLNHRYTNITKPIKGQGFIEGGSIIIEDDCFIGYDTCIFANGNKIRIGKHSVIGANSVVKESIPPFSIAVGAPAKVIKRYDFKKKKWVSVHSK